MSPITEKSSPFGDCSPVSPEENGIVSDAEEKFVSQDHSCRRKTRLLTDLSPRKRRDCEGQNTRRRNTSSPRSLTKYERRKEYPIPGSSKSSPIRGSNSVLFASAVPLSSRLPTGSDDNSSRDLHNYEVQDDLTMSQVERIKKSSILKSKNSLSEIPEMGRWPDPPNLDQVPFKAQGHDAITHPVQTASAKKSGPIGDNYDAPNFPKPATTNSKIWAETNGSAVGTDEHTIPVQSVESEGKQPGESTSQDPMNQALTLQALTGSFDDEIKDFFGDVPEMLHEVKQKVNSFQTQFDSLQEYLESVNECLTYGRSSFQQFLLDQSKELRLSQEQLLKSSSAIVALKDEVQNSKQKLLNEKSLATALKNEIIALKQNIESASLEIDSLKDVIDVKTEEGRKLKLEQASLNNQVEMMREQLRVLQELFDEKEATIRSMSLNLGNLVKETQMLNDEMSLIESEHNTMKLELAEKCNMVKLLKSSQENLEIECRRYEEVAEGLRINLASVEADRGKLAETLSHERERAESYISQIREKDEIISGDAVRLHALKTKVDSQKAEIAEFENTLIKANHDHTLSQNELLNQLEALKEQIITAQEKGDERIQKIAEQLYHQYSKKHEIKTNQLRQNYDVKLKEKQHQIQEYQKQVENLESRLRMESKEKEYVLSMLENGVRK